MKSLMGEADRLAYNVSNIEAQFSPTFQNFAVGKSDAPAHRLGAGSLAAIVVGLRAFAEGRRDRGSAISTARKARQVPW